MSQPGAGRRGPGRRPGGADTRAQVLAAARTEFATRGYDGASVRGIARAADVDPALVHHYFGSKEQVFVAAMALPFDPSAVLPGVLAGDPDGLAERVLRLFLSVYEDPASREPFLALLRSAMSSEQAAAMLRGFVSSALLGRMAAAVELPDRELRVSLAAAQMVGVAMLRYVVGVEPLASATHEELVELLTPTLQRYLSGGWPA